MPSQEQGGAAQTGILAGLRIIELSAFIAAPMAGLTLAQLGADVIRIDPVGGNVDVGRWPVTASGRSLYWACLNRGKRSVEIDWRRAEGRDLIAALITQAGSGGGIFLTNLPVPAELSYEALRTRRRDLIMVTLEGNPDGTTALDYTANAATGLPFVTGAAPAGEPVNHVLPAWDVTAALTLATAILAAERRRLISGDGEHIRVALSDIAIATVGNLAYLAEVEVNGAERQRLGNDIYGTFGRNFAAADGQVMIVAVTPRQWQALVDATGAAAAMADLAARLKLDFSDEGDRFRGRKEIAAVLAPWFAARTLADIRRAFTGTAVCWSPFQSFSQVVHHDARLGAQSTLFAKVDHPGIGAFSTAATPLRFAQSGRPPPAPAPLLGQHTDQVLREVLGLSAGQLNGLRASGILADKGVAPS
jgi:2-methylfumaryl-CoA isomerase